MKLYIARHAETNYNVAGLCNADPSVDVHLTSLGITQAKQLAEKLQDLSFEIIYISEFSRTRETASYLLQYDATRIEVDKRLNENIGGFEGQPSVHYQAAVMASQDPQHAKFNSGESFFKVNKRVAEFLTELRTKNFGSVLIITHGFIVESIGTILENRAFDFTKTFNVPQGEFRLYEIDPAKP